MIGAHIVKAATGRLMAGMKTREHLRQKAIAEKVWAAAVEEVEGLSEWSCGCEPAYCQCGIAKDAISGVASELADRGPEVIAQFIGGKA